MNIHLALLKAAALVVPGEQRAEWSAEWQSELWYVRRVHGEAATAFCLGAFHDALWLRRNSQPVRRVLRLESPLRCCLFLAALAAASAIAALLLPGTPKEALRSFDPAAEGVVTISRQSYPAAVSVERYRTWASGDWPLFSGLAFYQPIRARMRLADRQRAPELTVARASGNLFELLKVPAPASAPALILGQRAWRKYFDGSPDVIGRRLEIAGQTATVAGVIAEDSWQFPGHIDAWLLEDKPHFAALPWYSKGFVIARARVPRNGRWSAYLPNDQGNLERFNCVPPAKQLPPPFANFLAIIAAACLALPATTPLSLGEYPAKRSSFRRWIFLSIKFALIAVMVYCWALDLAYFSSGHSSGGLLVIASLAGCTLAFRWALRDQRQRCPVCLRLLGNPAHIGQHSRSFLEWSGTELMCAKGHGLLHVPETPTSWFSTQRWLYLDPSWSGLF